MSDTAKRKNETERLWSHPAGHTESYSYIAPEIIAMLRSLCLHSVLDVGCGDGYLCDLLDKHGFYIAGSEIDPKRVSAAVEAAGHLKFYNLGVQDNPAAILRDHPDKFDAVVSTEVIEHLYAPRQLPQFASQVLKPNGYLIISTPYHGYMKNMVISLLNKWDHHHTALWEGGHIKFWSKKTITSLLKENGYEITRIIGVGRVAYFWKSMIITSRLQP